MQNKDNSKRCVNQGKTVYSKELIEFNFRFHTNRVSTSPRWNFVGTYITDNSISHH